MNWHDLHLIGLIVVSIVIATLLLILRLYAVPAQRRAERRAMEVFTEVQAELAERQTWQHL